MSHSAPGKERIILPQPPASLCVLRLSAIGDVCHTLPVIRTLQAAWPQTSITWVIGRVEAQLMEGIAGVELLAYDKRGGRAARASLRRRLAGRRFDVLLQMQAALRASLLARSIRARQRLGFDRARAVDMQWLFTTHRIAPGARQHVLDGLFGFAEALGVHERVMRWDIPVADADRTWLRETLPARGPRVVISPCSSERRRNYRNWPLARYAEVARFAQDSYGAQVVLTGGGSELEHEYGEGLRKRLPTPPVNLIGRTTLKQLLLVLESARVLIGPDSGPVHMARAVATPVIGLYATSNPLRTGPYEALQWTVNRYPEALRRELGKAVEDVRWGRRVRNPHAMDLITVDAVIERLRTLFERADARYGAG